MYAPRDDSPVHKTPTDRQPGFLRRIEHRGLVISRAHASALLRGYGFTFLDARYRPSQAFTRGDQRRA